VNVTLELYELRLAAEVGMRRHLSAIHKGLDDAHGYNGDEGWTIHIEGAAGEMAFAKALNLYWAGTVDTFREGGDVGRIQVKTRSRHDYELLIRQHDRDEDDFVLVTGRSPDFTIRGWMNAAEAKREEWLQVYGGRPPAYFVPTSELNDISSLKVESLPLTEWVQR